ncbi:hypothetical protein B0H14DRAFT_2621877 [Mycena olivaceomarginata]|nr:hypothetical protein B0H14DRAFT_2621877 [Mycena olivaceomarginata]
MPSTSKCGARGDIGCPPTLFIMSYPTVQYFVQLRIRTRTHENSLGNGGGKKKVHIAGFELQTFAARESMNQLYFTTKTIVVRSESRDYNVLISLRKIAGCTRRTWINYKLKGLGQGQLELECKARYQLHSTDKKGRRDDARMTSTSPAAVGALGPITMVHWRCLGGLEVGYNRSRCAVHQEQNGGGRWVAERIVECGERVCGRPNIAFVWNTIKTRLFWKRGKLGGVTRDPFTYSTFRHTPQLSVTGTKNSTLGQNDAVWLRGGGKRPLEEIPGNGSRLLLELFLVTFSSGVTPVLVGGNRRAGEREKIFAESA